MILILDFFHYKNYNLGLMFCFFSSPIQDFPSAPWFLPYSFGTGKAPEGSIVNYAQSLTHENVNELVASHDIPYSIVKNFKADLNTASKSRIAQYERKLDTVLW